MNRIRYTFDGNRTEWIFEDSRWGFGNAKHYYTTNKDGEGIFVIYPHNNDRRQLVGTVDFYLTGSKAAKRAKIRRWIRARFEITGD